MTADSADISTDLPCHRCGYDLRAHPHDGICPECEASVAESRRLVAIPLRPAWRDADPRWRRRMLAGAWILVLLPLMAALHALEWDARLPVPALFESPGIVRTLNETLLSNMDLYATLAFCVGVALLFSKERGRRRLPLDWTRRWGVLCSYVALLLSAAPMLFITALVAVGISALFISMPPKYQPGMTDPLLSVSCAYLRYGPEPKIVAGIVLVAFSSITILLAYVPLSEALRRTGLRRVALILPAPLVLFSLIHLAEAAAHSLDSSAPTAEIFHYGVYFRPDFVLNRFADGSADLTTMPGPMLVAFVVEVAKWCTVLAIAVWLTTAQVVAWRRGKKTTSPDAGALGSTAAFAN
jgi:hypothetical protein